MTCIVALKTDDRIYLGGDSFCGNLSLSEKCEDSKVFTLGPLGVGICGGIRPEQVLISLLKDEVETRRVLDEEWLFDFMNKYQEDMKEKGASKAEDDMQLIPDSGYIFALHGSIYYIEDDYGTWKPAGDYASVGAGRVIAMGSLHTSINYDPSWHSQPEAVVHRALHASVDLSPFVTNPVSVVSVSNE